MNSTLESYLRAYIYYDQANQTRLLLLAELAISARKVESTSLLPFFLSYGYEISLFKINTKDSPINEEPRSPLQQGEAIARTLKEAYEQAYSLIVFSQQEIETQANRRRSPAPDFRVGDSVQLKLKNIKTDRPSKKLDQKNAKYRVIKVIGLYAIRLNTRPGVYNFFYIDIIRPSSTDPLPS